MRNILNISLPKEMVIDIKRGVKTGKFASTSEFMRHLIRVWNTENTDEKSKSLHAAPTTPPRGLGTPPLAGGEGGAPFMKGRITKRKL